MDEKTRDAIQKVFLDAVLGAKDEIENTYGIKTRVDFKWEAVGEQAKKGHIAM